VGVKAGGENRKGEGWQNIYIFTAIFTAPKVRFSPWPHFVFSFSPFLKYRAQIMAAKITKAKIFGTKIKKKNT